MNIGLKLQKKETILKRLRKKIGDTKIECYFDGDKEAKGKKFFSTGDLEVSYNDEMLAYSIDDKGRRIFYNFYKKNI